MRKLLFFFSIFLSFTLLGCQHLDKTAKPVKEEKETNEQSDLVVRKKDVREEVWKQLNPEQKEQIKGTWKDAKVTKLALNQLVIKFRETPTFGEVYVVDFTIKTNMMPNNMIVYANTGDYKILGYGIVE